MVMLKFRISLPLQQPMENPCLDFAGMFKDDPYFDEWQQAIAENRRKIDEAPNIP